jgi:transcriptional regulator of acetoin/glycerol metabolism
MVIREAAVPVDPSVAGAAEILGIDPSTLYRKIDRYGLQSA